METSFRGISTRPATRERSIHIAFVNDFIFQTINVQKKGNNKW